MTEAPNHERCQAIIDLNGRQDRRCKKFWDVIINGKKFCHMHAKDNQRSADGSQGKT